MHGLSGIMGHLTIPPESYYARCRYVSGAFFSAADKMSSDTPNFLARTKPQTSHRLLPATGCDSLMGYHHLEPGKFLFLTRQPYNLGTLTIICSPQLSFILPSEAWIQP